MDTMTHPLVETINTRFGGILTHGEHSPDGAACFHEAVNVARGEAWSDMSGNMPDLRGLNDAPWSSDAIRTKHMLPVGVALWDWGAWTPERRQEFAKRVAERTIREIVPLALRVAATVHPVAEHRKALEAAATTCVEEGAEATWATWAATWAARAARADAPLIAMCRIFVESAS